MRYLRFKSEKTSINANYKHGWPSTETTLKECFFVTRKNDHTATHEVYEEVAISKSSCHADLKRKFVMHKLTSFQLYLLTLDPVVKVCWILIKSCELWWTGLTGINNWQEKRQFFRFTKKLIISIKFDVELIKIEASLKKKIIWVFRSNNFLVCITFLINSILF